MKLDYVTFIKKLFVFTVIVALAGTGIAYLLPDKYVTPTIPFLYLFFFSATMVVHYVLLQVSLKKASSFINYFMLMTFGKLIFFLSIVMLYALIRREDAAQFIVAFFILYLCFTVFEVIQSLSLTKSINLRNKLEREKGSATSPEDPKHSS